MIYLYSNTPKYTKRGFTLIELSIVITIVALIIAGVTAGRSMVREAKFRNIIKDKDKYVSALTAFKLQYNALPGDITNAYSYWPSAGCTNQDVDTNSNGCNGDGDKQIQYHITANPLESLRAWQHLSLAQLIPETYQGKLNGSGKYQIGYNIPGSSFNSTVIINEYQVFFADLSQSSVFSDRRPVDNRFYPQDMQRIDAKIDDGIAYTGKFTAKEGFNYKLDTSLGGNGPCRLIAYGNPGGNTSDYNLNSQLNACRITFLF